MAVPSPVALPVADPQANAGFDPDAYLKEVTQPAAAAPEAAFNPDSYMDDELKKYVDDDNFDPLTLASEQPDKLPLAKEIEWRKSQRPMTGARAGQVAKSLVKSVPGIIRDFGAGAGAIGADAYVQATDDSPANVERAKTQQLARAQLIEQHGGSFMGKLLGPDSWLGKHIFTPERDAKSTADYKRAELDRTAPPGPAKDAALAKIDAEEKEALATLAAKPVENDRQTSDRLFDQKLAELQRSRELLKGNVQPDGMIADALKGVGNITRTLATGEPVNDDKSAVTNIFKSGDQLAAMGAPVDPEAIRTGAVTADPVNLLPLHVPGMAKVASKVGGGLLKAPAAIAGKVAENTPEVVSNILKKKLLGTAAVAGGGALTAEAMRDPAGAAKMLAAAGIATAGLAGARYFGRVMDTAGSKLLDPTFVSAAERAGAESAMNIEKAGGGQLSKFFDPAMNKADFERAIVKPIQSGVTAPIAMAPLNAALSDNPEEFGALSGTAMGFGAFSGATAYNPLKGFHPETVAAVDSILRDNGAKKKYGTPLDAQHDAFMAKAPEGVRDAVNSYRGFFDGFKMPNGREPQIYVLPSAEFGAEVAKRRPDIMPEHAAKQRGFAGKDGAILINGDYGGEAPGILGHEAGGHAAQSIMEVLAPEVAKSMDAAALKGLTDASGKPTPKLKAFVDAYNKEFDPTGKTKGIETTDHAIAEWLAEQGRAVLEGQGPAKFAAGTSLRQTIGDNLADHFHKVFGTKRMFDRSEVPALARQYRDLLFQLGRFRTQEGPQAAPPEAAPAPGAPPAAPAAPAGAAPAAAPVAAPAVPVAVDRATVSAALRSLFGVKQAEADAMAAAASGNTVEEMIANAAQAKSKANAGSSTTAPAAQPTPLQPAGQLAGVAAAAEPAGAQAAPAAQLAGFGESAVAPKAKIFVRRLPDGTFVDRQGNPVDPRTGLAPEAPNLDRGGAATPPEVPDRTVATPEDITGRVQAAEDAARAAEAGKKRRTPESREKATAQAVKEARIQALLDAAHESAPDEAHLQKREEFGTTKYTGRIDESIPAHRMLLDELGVSEGGRANIETLNANLGKPVFIRYKSAAKEGSSEAAQVDRTGKQRAKEYKAESVDSRIEDAQAGDKNTGVEQTKSFYPLGFRVNPATGSVTVTGFSPQRLLSNVGKIVEFMKANGRDAGYSGPDDPVIHEDMQGYAQNHANGYKGDGSGPIEGETPNANYEPYIFQDHTRFDLLNAAMGNESAKTPKSDREGAKARAGDLQDFAAANDTLVTPDGETNPLRQWLNENGFEFRNESGEVRQGTKDVLEPTIESLRVDPELMRDISTEAPDGESSLRPTGVADPSAMTSAGIPKARNVAAGFMPGHGPENGQLSEFGSEQDEPSIKSKVPKTDELGFYSRLRQHVEEADFGTSKPKAAQHWLGVIEKWAKGASTPTLGVQSRGIARDELEWSGVKEWLKSQGSEPLKKADVLNFIDHNGVQVQEVQKGGGDSKGDAYYLDDEIQDHGDTGGDGGGLWTIDAYPSGDHFGDEHDRMDSKPMAFISKKGPAKHGVISLRNGNFSAYHGDDYVGEFESKEEARQAIIDDYGPEEEGAPQFEVWDGPSNSHHGTFSTLAEAKRNARELASENIRHLNEEHADEEGAGTGGTQFSGWKLDGGTNYKEVLLTLPERESDLPSERQKLNFTDSHWSEPNVVAHFRQQDFEGNTRTVREDGKGYTKAAPEKVRHIDEFQSDWHQKGRDRGYRGDQEPLSQKYQAERNKAEDAGYSFEQAGGFSGGDYVKNKEGKTVGYLTRGDGRGVDDPALQPLLDAYKAAVDNIYAIPDAPFKKTWSQLAFKRALKLAVEDGMDRMSWSTGDQNIEHYKRALVAEVDKVTWTHPMPRVERGTKVDEKVVTLSTNHHGALKFSVDLGGEILKSYGDRVGEQFVGKSLAEVIGKENAKKVLEPGGEGEMDGEGMEVGGDGMRTFYDEMIPQFAKKYVEKWGSKVEDVVLPNGETVHSVEITPEMKAAVEQGQPMFMPGQGAEPAAGDLSSFGDEPSIKSKVEWAQPKRAKAAGDVIVNVKTSAFDEAFQKDHGFYIDKDGNGEIKGRRDRFKEFLKEGKAIEMPEVVITKEGTAAFVNGRHRFSVMRDAGVESIPMSMDETSALRAQTLGMTVEGSKSKGGDLGNFMPSDATGRGEFDVKEKKPLDERRARLMADMQGQAKWLNERAKEKGFDSADEMAAKDFNSLNELAAKWREDHPRFDDAGNQLFMPGTGEPIESVESAGADPKDKKAARKAWVEKKTESPWFKRWFGKSKVVDDEGNPLMVFSGHSNPELYGDAYDPKKGTAGAFYATEDTDIASNYAMGKMGVRENYENGSQYRFKLKNGKFGKKIWQLDLTPEQQQKVREFLNDDKNGMGLDLEAYWKDNAPYDADARRAQYQGLSSLANIYKTMESLGYTVAYPREAKTLPSGEREPMFLTQEKNNFEELLDHLGIEWQSHDWSQPGVQPLYLHIENPIDASEPFPPDLLSALKAASKRKRNSPFQYELTWTKDYPLKQWVADIEEGNEYWTTHIPKDALPIIKSFGYDGIKELGLKGEKDRSKRQINWLAFDPEQIKSASGNQGTFDESNPSMLAMPGTEPRRTWFMRNGKRVYHHRGEAGQFSEKPVLAKPGASAISQKKDDNAKAQLETFK